MKKTFLSLALLALVVVVCIGMTTNERDKEKDTTFKELTVSNLRKTDCRHGLINPKLRDSISVSYKENTLFVEHYRYSIPCGQDSLNVYASISNDTIWIEEAVYGLGANCICWFNSFYQIDNIEKGNYVVIIENCSWPYYELYPSWSTIVYNQILKATSKNSTF